MHTIKQTTSWMNILHAQYYDICNDTDTII